jgi:hypothetical protein
MASQDLVDKFYELTKKFGSKEKAKKFIYANDIIGDIATEYNLSRRESELLIDALEAPQVKQERLSELKRIIRESQIDGIKLQKCDHKYHVMPPSLVIDDPQSEDGVIITYQCPRCGIKRTITVLPQSDDEAESSLEQNPMYSRWTHKA